MKKVEGMKDEKSLEFQRCLCRFPSVEGKIMASLGEILKLEKGIKLFSIAYSMITNVI